MTKAEVLNNIRYNENLIRDFGNKRLRLESKLHSCHSEDQNLRKQVADAEMAARAVNDEIYELERLRGKINKLYEEFEERQNRRISAYNNHVAGIFFTNFFSSYISGMKSLLTGVEYRKTLQGLSEAVEKVKRKMSEKQRKKEDINNRIRNLRARRDSVNCEINSIRNQIEQVEKDIAYRKRRMRYWQDQLKYATD